LVQRLQTDRINIVGLAPSKVEHAKTSPTNTKKKKKKKKKGIAYSFASAASERSGASSNPLSSWRNKFGFTTGRQLATRNRPCFALDFPTDYVRE
jgi:hypothetical protein